ncbi:STAS domain-containing protein [Cyanobium sp. CH-040]|uniref:STAS domain-containing protein n=1 Tax=Cyanobium sp. CH-040 TaxID=2823708 RepID=UPI0020CC546D|nr:STAS domain-containing protein [Cyanobium sp. CH-040]MCP9928364.1 STAS domain-containing protein [Cyanobium sp. CH-040]
MALTINIESAHPLVSLYVEGQVDTQTAPQLLDTLTKLQLGELEELRIFASGITFLSSAGLRALVFAKQKMPHTSSLVVVGASDMIKDVIIKTGLGNAVRLLDAAEGEG